VKKLIISECKKLYEDGITENELELGKKRYFAKTVFDTNDSILNFVVNIRLNNISIEDVNAYLENYNSLTLMEVNRAIKGVFNPQNLVLVTCGKATVKGEEK
jgi:predicted Zn-dependent peptidase